MQTLNTSAPNGVSVHQTLDPTIARTVLSDRYKPHVMRRVSGVPFNFTHLSAVVPEGTFNVLRYGGAVEIEPEPFDDFFMLEMPISEGVTIESAGQATVRSDQGNALFLPPHVRFASTWRDGCVQLMLKIRNAEVLRRWQFMTKDEGAELPRVHPQIDLQSPEGWRVQQMLTLMRREMEKAVTSQTDTLSTSPLAGATIDAVLAYYLKKGGLAKDGDSEIAGRHQIQPTQLRTCVAYIERNLAADLSIQALVQQAGVSERTLFNLFQHFLRVTPKGYVQQQRLRHSRSLLQAGGFSVAQAARQSGFAHLGRFSALYRKRYGENPSHT